jgi:soluble lytic murein transglycosylase-like protein
MVAVSSSYRAAAQGGPYPPAMNHSSNGDMTPQQVMATYRDEIQAASEKSGVPPELIAAMIWQESKGRPFTPGGGLMQLGPNEFWNFGGGDINHPADNIMAGAMYMKELLGQFGGNAALALRGYNSGPYGVDLHNPDATPVGTGDPTYVAKVMMVARSLGLA